jgi:hypothetical protein
MERELVMSKVIMNFNSTDHSNYDHEAFDTNMLYLDIKDEIIKQNNCPTMLGNGSFGSVYKVANTDQVIKICATRNLEGDAYHSVLNIFMKVQNPFFPIIEKFIKYKSSDDGEPIYVYGVKMERLYSIGETSKDILHKLGEQLLDDFKGSEFYGTGKDPGYTLSYTIKSCCNAGHYDRVKNPILIEACKMIMELRREKGHYNDMGQSNFMIRQTPNWETLQIDHQLVITDPLS